MQPAAKAMRASIALLSLLVVLGPGTNLQKLGRVCEVFDRSEGMHRRGSRKNATLDGTVRNNHEELSSVDAYERYDPIHGQSKFAVVGASPIAL